MILIKRTYQRRVCRIVVLLSGLNAFKMLVNQALKANIKNRLDQKEMTIRELESRAGLRQSVLQNILLGRSKNPGVETVYALAKELGCTVEELLLPPDPNNFQHKAESEMIKLHWNESLFAQSVAFVGDFIKKNAIETNLEKAWSCIKEIYAYALKETTTNKIDQKFAEWITERNLLRN